MIDVSNTTCDRDTVSSIGIFRGKSLPGTNSQDHVCHFRHALALDERRVKFLPEYALGGAMPAPTNVAGKDHPDMIPCSRTASEEDIDGYGRAHIKEVWFPGTHSDM